MKPIKTVALIAVATLGIVACKKNGTGGKATIAASPEHHGKAIYGATAYIKFDAKELPADPTTNYDLKIVGSPKENHVHIEGMRQGNYFLYMVGYDSSAAQLVKAGVPVKIKYSERAKEIDVKVPVTE